MTVVPFKDAGREAPKADRSAMETRVYRAEETGAWKIPPFQRPVRVNAKVLSVAEEIKREGGVLTGIITLGKLKNDPDIYVVDGQHRLKAVEISGVKEFLSDFRLMAFESMAEMAEEFERVNSNLVRMRPDDMLRALEYSYPLVKQIREECPFVGYDQIRRGTAAPVLSMAVLLRAWLGSTVDTPTAQGGSAASMPALLTPEDTENCIRFLTVCNSAWGRNPEYHKLWGALNLTLCMWLWRRMVVEGKPKGRGRRFDTLNVKQFRDGLMALSADSNYIDWLYGRLMREKDRGPCYGHIKRIMGRRLREEVGSIRFPQEAWVTI